MDGLTVVSWRKWGHDFLYVNDAAGTALGYYDRSSGQLHVADQAMRQVVIDALAPQLGNGVLASGFAPEAAEAGPVGSDLAGRVAGAAVAEQAARLSAGWFQRWAARLLGVRTEATSWEVGARGERIVGRRLDRLRAHGWEVLHSIPLPSGADIDHVLIGPGGVFTVNTKHHARVWVGGDQVMVNEQRQSYVRNSRHKAAAAARRLSAALGWTVQVLGVVVFVRPGSLTVRKYPSDVLITKEDSVSNMRGMRPALSADGVRAVFQAARRSEIWTSR